MKKMKLLSVRILMAMAILSFSTLSFSPSTMASTIINESELDFNLLPSALEKGDVQIGLDMRKSAPFFEQHPFFQEIDFFRLGRFTSDHILAAKFAFIVNKGLESFSKDRIFNAEDFEKISKNVKVTHVQEVSSTNLSFEIRKKIKFYNITSHVEFFHFDRDEFELHPELDSVIERHFNSPSSSRSLPSPPSIPSDGKASIVTLHESNRFSNFFNGASNLCFYLPTTSVIPATPVTLVTCYMMSSLNKFVVNTIGNFVNFKGQLREEILHSVRKIKNSLGEAD